MSHLIDRFSSRNILNKKTVGIHSSNQVALCQNILETKMLKNIKNPYH